MEYSGQALSFCTTLRVGKVNNAQYEIVYVLDNAQYKLMHSDKRSPRG